MARYSETLKLGTLLVNLKDKGPYDIQLHCPESWMDGYERPFYFLNSERYQKYLGYIVTDIKMKHGLYSYIFEITVAKPTK